MKWNRLFAYLMGCIALASSFLVYMKYIYLLGFPDGFITELGYAERKLAYIFIGISFILSSWFIYLGAIALRKKIGKKLLAAIILYLISIVSLYTIDYYYRLHLMDSSGG
jgi:amino acid permease